METIDIGGFVFFVRRSARRSVCIRVLDDGTPQILAPLRISDAELRRIVLPYRDRMAVDSDNRRQAYEASCAFSLSYGDSVRFLGGVREICRGENGRISYDENAFYIPPELEGDDIRDAVIAVYKLAAKNYLTDRVDTLSMVTGCVVKAVKINSATSHWASCSKRDTLNFSWFCIMAEADAVDYIIIHELCHMYEFNHSPRFWELVGQYCPDYKKHRAYLRSLWKDIASEKWK